MVDFEEGVFVEVEDFCVFGVYFVVYFGLYFGCVGVLFGGIFVFFLGEEGGGFGGEVGEGDFEVLLGLFRVEFEGSCSVCWGGCGSCYYWWFGWFNDF